MRFLRLQKLFFSLKLLVGRFIAKLVVTIFGLKNNCLLTRHPLIWIQPDFIDCINLNLLKEHGYQVQVYEKKEDFELSQNPGHVLAHPPKNFKTILNYSIFLAEKDLLEF